ncbi:MAG: hypothetical protein Q9209_000537 [Squamulea sp. 1 TL-2023]
MIPFCYDRILSNDPEDSVPHASRPNSEFGRSPTKDIVFQSNGLMIYKDNDNYVAVPARSQDIYQISHHTSNFKSNQAEENSSSNHKLSDSDSSFDWSSFGSSARVTEFQTPDFNVSRDEFQSPSKPNTVLNADPPIYNRIPCSSSIGQFGDWSSYKDINGSDSESVSSGTRSIESLSLNLGTTYGGDLSSYGDIDDILNSSEPEIFQPTPKRIGSAFNDAGTNQSEDLLNLEGFSDIQDDYNWKHLYDHPPIDHLPSRHVHLRSNQHPYDETISFINNGYPLPAGYLQAPAPQTAADYFAHLATQRCADRTPSEEDPTSPAYPDHHPLNPPRTILTSLPSLTSAIDEIPQQSTAPPIIPASSQQMFTSITTMIAKANTSKKRAHDFGYPSTRKCFGLRLPPSRKFVSPPTLQRRRRGPDKGPRKRSASKEGGGESATFGETGEK